MLTESDVVQILCGCCGHDLDPDTELTESGILDSLGVVLLAEALEERGITVSVARIPKAALATPRALAAWLQAQSGAGPALQ